MIMIDGKPVARRGSISPWCRSRDVHLGIAQDRALTPGGDPRALATFMVVALLTLGMAV